MELYYSLRVDMMEQPSWPWKVIPRWWWYGTSVVWWPAPHL